MNNLWGGVGGGTVLFLFNARTIKLLFPQSPTFVLWGTT